MFTPWKNESCRDANFVASDDKVDIMTSPDVQRLTHMYGYE